MSDLCPFFSAMGCTSAIVFTCKYPTFGTSFGGPETIKCSGFHFQQRRTVPDLLNALANIGASKIPVLRPDQMMKCVVPVIMAGIIAVLSVYMSLAQGFVELGAGLSVGLAGLAAGFAIGIVGDPGVRGTAQQPRLFAGMILILIFAEVLGLYGTSSSVYKSFLVFCLSSILAACPCSPSFRPLHLTSIPFLVPLSSWRYPLLSFSHHARAKWGANHCVQTPP
ncbi:hypothetical protein B0H13DRAFT_2052792 [Mycena leptocephala]|nr:hypothetical protein B0H13DRAFT_2052792 [Mycena leptocephala]